MTLNFLRLISKAAFCDRQGIFPYQKFCILRMSNCKRVENHSRNLCFYTNLHASSLYASIMPKFNLNLYLYGLASLFCCLVYANELFSTKHHLIRLFMTSPLASNGISMTCDCSIFLTFPISNQVLSVSQQSCNKYRWPFVNAFGPDQFFVHLEIVNLI